jgi:hypothetical protein
MADVRAAIASYEQHDVLEKAHSPFILNVSRDERKCQVTKLRGTEASEDQHDVRSPFPPPAECQLTSGALVSPPVSLRSILSSE